MALFELLTKHIAEREKNHAAVQIRSDMIWQCLLPQTGIISESLITSTGVFHLNKGRKLRDIFSAQQIEKRKKKTTFYK